MRRLINEAVNEFESVSKGLTLRLSVQEGIKIYADRERIGQVLANILSNAIKYSPQGGAIEIWTEAEQGEVQVNIKDDGIGIPEDATDKVFDRFFRVPGEKMDTYPGLGLGLNISADIVKRHGGSIGVQSKPGNGSLFYFTLPNITEKDVLNEEDSIPG